MTHFTIEELNLIGEFIDIATKAHGFNVAERAFPIVQKMRVMAKELSAPVAQTEEILPPIAEAAE